MFSFFFIESVNSRRLGMKYERIKMTAGQMEMRLLTNFEKLMRTVEVVTCVKLLI